MQSIRYLVSLNIFSNAVAHHISSLHFFILHFYCFVASYSNGIFSIQMRYLVAFQALLDKVTGLNICSQSIRVRLMYFFIED